MTEAKGILAKLSSVSKACSYIQKDSENQFHRYSYASAALVYEKVNQALWDHGLVSIPTVSIVSDIERVTPKGTKEHMVTVALRLEVLDVEGNGRIETVAYGCGVDPTDKAVMKAQTAALKYAWINLLNISTGDDPEGDAKIDAQAAGTTIRKQREKTQGKNRILVTPSTVTSGKYSDPHEDGGRDEDHEQPAGLL